jgi:hemolysin III
MAITWTEENASEEAVNAWTHGMGALASVPAGIALCWLAYVHRMEQFLPCLVYSISLFSMYLFSSLSHAVKTPQARLRVRQMDQGVIYTLISGTFTPFVCEFLSGWVRTGLMTAIWMAAFAGFYSKVFAKHRINNMTSITYVLLGWLPSMVLFPYVPGGCFLMMAIGGVLYTVGTLFLQNDHRAWFFHAIWHSLVILASGVHYAAIMLYCVRR